jgi:hypothetical protein
MFLPNFIAPEAALEPWFTHFSNHEQTLATLGLLPLLAQHSWAACVKECDPKNGRSNRT